MTKSGQAPRLAALQLVDGVTIRKRLLSELTRETLARLPDEERARALRLATSGLRWMDRADRLLGPHLKKRPPPEVLNMLRLATAELFVDGSAAHGVVHSYVDIARGTPRSRPFSGLINAVLRKVSASPPETWAALPLPRMPKWLRKPLLADYGKPVIEAMEAAHAKGAPLDLTVKADPQEWAERLGGQVTPTGSVRLQDNAQVSALAGFGAGSWWVQDAAAALPARLLAAQPGEKVLDMCAAPGGKTMQLAATGAKVTALDLSAKRMDVLRENLARTGLNADLVTEDALYFAGGPFDAILLDAPCSATGTIRRHPDLAHAKTGEGFPELFALQEKMLDHAIGLLKPGGRLVYCTCSLLFDEGEEQINDLKLRMPDIRVDTGVAERLGLPAEWQVSQGLRTRPDHWPDTGGMDGFFMTLLQKPADWQISS